MFSARKVVKSQSCFRICNSGRFYSGLYKVPEAYNEPTRTFERGSTDRAKLEEAIAKITSTCVPEIPLVIDGKEIFTSEKKLQIGPFNGKPVAQVSQASAAQVGDAIEASLIAKSKWAKLPWDARVAVFAKSADLITGPYRYEHLAATMVSQGKNAHQAEIDCTCELADFLRFNNQYAEMLYSQQPLKNAPGVWNRAQYRPLEGFVYAVTPFNFTAIAGNLTAAPALMGNGVIWKPSDNAALSNYKVLQAFIEAGVPDGLINFVPGDAVTVTEAVLSHPDFAALHFTGSTAVFQKLYQDIATNLPKYKSYPRIVGETGGKNFHLLHPSADVPHAVCSTVRGAFEYQGQKCSATSRAYVPKSLWPEFKAQLIKETQHLTQGNSLKPAEFNSFMGPVIHDRAFAKVSEAITTHKQDPTLELITGGIFSDKSGYYIEPTVFVAPDPLHSIMKTEYFGPLLAVYVYEDAQLDNIVKTVDYTTEYGLTGSIFAQDRQAIVQLTDALENAAGNFYINDKSTGAVVGQQWFGGARKSGTNDKAGSQHLLSRFVTVRNIKENAIPVTEVFYPSNK